ncbi:MAG: hypothetical protein F4076_06625 [Acidimicrobiaceae bacterium]|nr:hypothetical protein [Acidimicrobiaceae bacterium]MYJ42105.1 hypothetical protein [Acidimicrobiaceae bacterium]
MPILFTCLEEDKKGRSLESCENGEVVEDGQARTVIIVSDTISGSTIRHKTNADGSKVVKVNLITIKKKGQSVGPVYGHTWIDICADTRWGKVCEPAAHMCPFDDKERAHVGGPVWGPARDGRDAHEHHGMCVIKRRLKDGRLDAGGNCDTTDNGDRPDWDLEKRANTGMLGPDGKCWRRGRSSVG